MPNLFIFSNIKMLKPIKVETQDILVFINTADNFQLYKNADCKKLLFRRFLLDKKVYAGSQIQQVQSFYIRGPEHNLRKDYNYYITDYDFNFESEVSTKQPTTGWLVYKYCKQEFTAYNIKLINFLPLQDFSTQHCLCHNWSFQEAYYKTNHIERIRCCKSSLPIGSKEQVTSYDKLLSIFQNIFNNDPDFKSIKNIKLLIQDNQLQEKLLHIKKDLSIYNAKSSDKQCQKFDMVVCTNYIQRVESKYLDTRIKEIKDTGSFILFDIDCNYTDFIERGDNEYLIKDAIFWQELFERHFDIVTIYNRTSNNFICICYTENIKKKRNIVLTTTYNRPQIQFLCHCLNAQTVKPDLWLIIYNGDKSPAEYIKTSIPYIIIHNYNIVNMHPLTSNLYKALQYITDQDKVVICDDDDYYPPTYFQQRLKDLNTYDLVGQNWRIYLNLKQGTWKIFRINSFANGQSLAFTNCCIKLRNALDVANLNKNKCPYDARLSQNRNIKNSKIYKYKNPMISLVGWGIGAKGQCNQHRNIFKRAAGFKLFLRSFLSLQDVKQIDKIAPNLNMNKYVKLYNTKLNGRIKIFK